MVEHIVKIRVKPDKKKTQKNFWRPI